MDAERQSVSKVAVWTGWIVGTPPALLVAMAGMMNFSRTPQVLEGLKHTGYPESVATPLGVVALCCAALYMIPRTAVLGAILLTGYFGGAIATHVRIEEAQFVIAAAMGVMVWLGLFLRDRRVRVLIPFRK